MLSDSIIKETLHNTIELAEKALSLGNYPIGSVITDQDGNKLASFYNECTTKNDTTAHAEILCIRSVGEEKIAKGSEHNFYLFSSLEPCYGCSFFIARTNISKVFSALKDPHKGGIGDFNRFDHFRHFFEHIELIVEPYPDLMKKSKELMRKYFLRKGRPDAAVYYGYSGETAE
jgi:tRNA(adenine34) deaminase